MPQTQLSGFFPAIMTAKLQGSTDCLKSLHKVLDQQHSFHPAPGSPERGYEQESFLQIAEKNEQESFLQIAEKQLECC